MAFPEAAGAAFCYVTTTGRRTGRSHTIEIWFAASPATPTIYVLTFGRSDTVRNLAARPDVTIRVAGRDHRATARLVAPGTEEAARARRLVVDKYQPPGASDLESWGANALVVAFDLA